MERPTQHGFQIANKRLKRRLHSSNKPKKQENSCHYSSMASVQAQKHNEMCQKQSHHTKSGQKNCEMTNKAFKGHGNTNTNINGNAKTETHCYTETQTAQNVTDKGEAKTEITLLVVQARITQTIPNHPPAYPRGTTTTGFGNHPWKNRDHSNKKDRNLFRRIKDGVSRHNNCDADSSSDSDSDKENNRTRKQN